MASYASRVRQDILRWTELGLIDTATGDALRRDTEANERKSLSFGSVLAVMAALLFGAAILLLIAANWDAFPRLLRVGVLFAIIFAAYVGGALLKSRGNSAVAEGAWLVGAAAFGGSIALIGQMYHLSGDEADAVLTWCAGTALAAAALRSGPLTVAAVGLASSWLFLEGVAVWSETHVPHSFVLVAIGLWLLSYWTESRASRNLLLLSLIFYAALSAVHHDMLVIPAVLALVSAGLFAAAVHVPDAVERIARIDGNTPVHALLGFLTGMTILQFDLVDESAALVAAALVGFAGIAAAVVLGGRESRGLRWIAYLGFTCQLAYVYVVTVGTMLGTAGVFLASGLALGLVALVIIRVERRMNDAAGPQEGAA
ncbi:DUF2157 domain-containing protein [Mesorhizobium sp. AaZ16]|uniref:DUF2157 domain-containing protein n=1 Tax=Mesorhizobium sp. AaZ16 TaxID=3402289 RepID=UPI00374E9618